MKSGRKRDPVIDNRIRLNAGRVSTFDLAFLLRMTVPALEGRAKRMGVSLRLRKINET